MPMTVQRGYVSDAGGQLVRTLVDSSRRIYLGGEWAHADREVITVPGTYGRCWDVPHAWIGAVPYWR